MKKLTPFLVLAFVVSLSGCKFGNDSGEKDYTVVIEKENVPSTISYGSEYSTLDYYNGKPLLKVVPTSEGLHISFSPESAWLYNSIRVVNETNGVNNATVINLNEKYREFNYPFVKKGETYKLFVEHQEVNYSNWGSSDNDSGAVKVEAIGGYGNFTVSFRKYIYNNSNKTLTFKRLKITRPSLENFNPSFTGPLFLGGVWSNPSKYGYNYTQNENILTLTDEAQSFVNGSKKISTVVSLEGYYKDYTYSVSVLSDQIYRYSEFNKMVKLSGKQSIPSVYLDVYGGWVDGTTCHASSDWTDASIRITNTSDYPLELTNIKIKDRGNSTKWTAKVPYSLKFPEKTKVLGMKKHKRWVLMANYFDRSLIRTQLAGYLGNNIFNSYWNAQFTPVNVYWNNTFIGTYDLGECNKIAKQRIDIQSIEDYVTNDVDYIDVNGDGIVDIEDAGFMVEIDTAINRGGALTVSNYKTKVATDSNGAERVYFYSSEKCIPMTLKEPDFGDSFEFSDEVCKEVGTYAKSKIDNFEKMLYSSSFESEYSKYIDVTSFADWYLINEFAKNSDANFQKSVPVTYNPATGKLYMGPNWDFDLGFGNFNHSYESDFGGTTVDDPEGWYIWGGKKGCDENALYCQVNSTSTVQSWWINRLMESSSFKKAVKLRWQLKRTDFKVALETVIIQYSNRVYDSIPKNEEILPRLGVNEWNGPSGYANRVDYEDEISYLYNWCMERYNWMDKEINKW